MIVDRYDPVNLFEMVPKLELEMDPVLARLDRLLEDDVLFERVKVDLLGRYPNSERLGRRSTPVEVILRMLVVRRLYDWSYEQTEHFVSDSLVLRQFTRLYFEPAPDDTTLIRWARLIEPRTLQRLNERIVELAKSLKVTRGRKLRTDGTVVETAIHHPSDNSLLSDGVRGLGRLLKQAKRHVPDKARAVAGLYRDRSRSAKRLARRIGEAARRRGQEAKTALRGAYERLLEVTKASLAQAERVRRVLEEGVSSTTVAERLVGELGHFAGLVGRVVEQAERRVLEGQKVPADEKLVSIFEPHTQIIRRGKVGKSTEFGRKVWLDEVDGGLISGWRILCGNPSDESQLLPSLENHRRLFGRPPRLITADRGVYSQENEQAARRMGVERVALPKRGAKTKERRRYEQQGWFRRAGRFRAGVEGRISVCKRRGFLGRCREHGEEGMGRWVGWGVFTANLSTIARALAAR